MLLKIYLQINCLEKNPLGSHIQHLVPANISAHQICLAHSPVEEDCAVLLIHW